MLRVMEGEVAAIEVAMLRFILSLGGAGGISRRERKSVQTSENKSDKGTPLRKGVRKSVNTKGILRNEEHRSAGLKVLDAPSPLYF